jgi:3-oxoadipate enol-lactonase
MSQSSHEPSAAQRAERAERPAAEEAPERNAGEEAPGGPAAPGTAPPEPATLQPATLQPVTLQPATPPVTVYGDGTPVVLLHAFPLDSRMWLPQVEALGGYQVIVPDLRGFGAAREQAGEITPMDLLADDLAKLFDERRLERVVLCGLSMGGYVALAFARLHPERLGGLVLCDSRAGADSDGARAARLAMAERVLAEGVGFLPEVMVPRLLGTTTRQDRPELAEQISQTIRDQDPRGIAAAQRGMAERPDSTTLLGQISVPTLVITGMQDELIAPEEGIQMAAAIRDARLIQVPGAGHLVNLEQADLVNEALLNFVAPLWI